MLAIPTFPFAQRPTFADPKSALVREPLLMVPGMQPLGPVRIDWNNSITNGLKRFFLYNQDGFFHELVSGVLWGRYSGYVPSKNRYGCGVVSYNQNGTSTNTVLLNANSVSANTFVTVGYVNTITAYTTALYLITRSGGFSQYIGYWNTGTSLRASSESTSLESGSFYAAGDLVTVAFSRDQVADQLHAVFCKNCAPVVVVGPSARTAPVTYDGDERYHLAGENAAAQPLMCLMEFARVLSVAEKIDIVRNPYQFLIPA